MVWENFQRGQELREQQGGHLSKFLIGTVEAAHCVVPVLDVGWNNRNVYMTYDCLQSRPSPLGMRSYEPFDPSSATFSSDVFMKYNKIHVSDSPCFSGDCVHSYKEIIHL
jgi:hypothetical protein